MNGYIKLHRSILNNPIACKDSDYFSVWIYMLLQATHEEHPALFGATKILLKPGQFISGRKAIADKLYIQESKVKRIITALKNDQMIDQQTCSKGSLFTVKNWEVYQSNDQQSDQQVTSKRPASDQQVTTKQEGKKERREESNNKYPPSFEQFWKSYPRKIEKGNAYKQYNARLNEGYAEETMLKACTVYANQCKQEKTETKYIKHASTFLSKTAPFMDFITEGNKDGVEQQPESTRKEIISTSELAAKQGVGENISEMPFV